MPLWARPALAVALLVLGGCLTAHPRVPDRSGRPAAAFAPDDFFDGWTRGLGVLSVRLRSPELLCVVGRGRAQPDGTFRLDQTVTYPDGRTTGRTWTLGRASPTVWTGTLTDADGTVTAEATGDELAIRYRMGSPGVTMRQRLVLQPDGRTALNLSTVRVLGVPVARLVEHIQKTDGPVRCGDAAPPGGAPPGGAEPGGAIPGGAAE